MYRNLAIGVMATMTAGLATPGKAAEESPSRWFNEGRTSVADIVGKANAGGAKNVILFLGDGMGISTVSAARILAGQQAGATGEEHSLSFEELPKTGLVKTYNTNQQVPDSAGTMTAIMTGVKTKAGLISLNQKAVRGDCGTVAASYQSTLLERAELQGLSTGVVTTARLTHATPAATYAHSPERGWESDADMPAAAIEQGCLDIARQFVNFDIGDGIEVALGGGREKFLPESKPDPEEDDETGEREDGRDLTREWREKHSDGQYIWNRAQFEAVNPESTQRLLGLFESSHMKYELERQYKESKPGAIGEPSLSEMTDKAIDILSKNKDGYFLMVEAGRIDHGHHFGSAIRALTETVELSNAVQVALDKVDLKDTLIIVTADHSHVFTMGGYPTRGNPILGKVKGNDRSTGEPTGKYELDDLGRPYTTLSYANGPGYTGASKSKLMGDQDEGSKKYPHAPTIKPGYGSYRGITSGRPDLTHTETDHHSYLQESTLPLPLETHGGEDVAVYSIGPGSKAIGGVMEQNVLFHVMMNALSLPCDCDFAAQSTD